MRVRVLPLLPQLPRWARASPENPFHRSDGAEMASGRSPKGIRVGLRWSNVTATAGGCLSPGSGIKLKPNHVLVTIVPFFCMCRYPLTSSGSCCPTVSCAMMSRLRGLQLRGRALGLAAAVQPLCTLQWVKQSRNWLLESQRAWGQLHQRLVPQRGSHMG